MQHLVEHNGVEQAGLRCFSFANRLKRSELDLTR
jgi:hypothetical protein